jgi:hypothetical protein
MGDTAFLASGSLSLADLYLVPVLHCLMMVPDESQLGRHPGLACRWRTRSKHLRGTRTMPQLIQARAEAADHGQLRQVGSTSRGSLAGGRPSGTNGGGAGAKPTTPRAAARVSPPPTQTRTKPRRPRTVMGMSFWWAHRVNATTVAPTNPPATLAASAALR